MAGMGKLNKRKPWLAAFLSVIVSGWGQVYNGQWQKGVIFFVMEFLLGVCMMLAMGTFAGLVTGIAVMLAFNVYVVVDAFVYARRALLYRLKRCNSLAFYGLIAVLGLSIGMISEHVIKTHLYGTYKAPSGSMRHTLHVGDHFIVESLGSNDAIERGQVVVFLERQSGLNYVKRVIGLPGDTVEIRAQQVFINGKAFDEPYVWHQMADFKEDRDDFGPLQLESTEYFVMGDNRERSYDSRWLGPVDREAIKGVARYVYFPGGIGDADWLDRLGTPISER